MSRLCHAAVCALSAIALSATAVPAAAQQDYPTRSIHLISPYSPGGGNDIVARLLAQKLTDAWGQQVIVENRPGGNTIIGTDATAKAPPDGYTILLAPSSHVVVPLLMKTPYDPFKDFAPVASLASGEHILLLNSSIPVQNLQEFISLTKSKPAELNYATYGSGSTAQLAAELFNMTVGVKMQHIPYKGTGPALADLIGGQVQVFFSTIPPAIPHINSGRLKAVAITGEKRLTALPQVPTFDEGGLAGFARIGSFYGVITTGGTPKVIVDKLSAQVARILTQADFVEKLAAQGLVPLITNPEQYTARLKEFGAVNARIIKAANIRMEQ